MAKLAAMSLFLFFLSLLTVCSSGTLVGFSYNAGGTTSASTLSRTVSFLQQNKVSASHIRVHVADHRRLSTLSHSRVAVDLYLSESLVEDLISSKSWLKIHVVPFLPDVNIKSITLTGSNDLPKLLSTLKLVHSVLSSFHFDREFKVSVAFSLPLLEKLSRTQEHDLHRIFNFIKRIKSSVIVEAGSDNDAEPKTGNLFFQSMIQKAAVTTSLLHCNDVPIVLKVKSLVVSTPRQVAEFSRMVSKALENNQIASQVAELYADLLVTEAFAERELKREHEQIFPSLRRQLLKNLQTTLHDVTYPPTTIFPTNPANPTPTIVTVPATNPSTTPANPLPVPTTTPVTFPPANPYVNPPITNPVTTPAPVTNPVTTPAPFTNPVTTAAPITIPGAQPITNPVTTYPAPVGNVPATNPAAPTTTTNAPAIPGQSWCVAKTGVSETALQAALDYACGMGGADCSQIQQGGSCYNPSTLQNHASYAFNSYYQKNPAATSCDFGGTAMIVNTNPSTGTCIYPSSATTSTSSLPTPTTPTTNPATTSSLPGTGTTGTVTPPSVLNSSSSTPGSTTVFGSDTPPGVNTSTSKSAALQPFITCIILVASFFTRTLILNM